MGKTTIFLSVLYVIDTLIKSGAIFAAASISIIMIGGGKSARRFAIAFAALAFTAIAGIPSLLPGTRPHQTPGIELGSPTAGSRGTEKFRDGSSEHRRARR